MKEKIGMMGQISKMDNSKRKENGLIESLTMIKVPEIIIGEMIEMGMANQNGEIKITRSLEQINGDPMIMSQNRRTMSGDRTRHQTNGEQIMS